MVVVRLGGGVDFSRRDARSMTRWESKVMGGAAFVDGTDGWMPDYCECTWCRLFRSWELVSSLLPLASPSPPLSLDRSIPMGRLLWWLLLLILSHLFWCAWPTCTLDSATQKRG